MCAANWISTAEHGSQTAITRWKHRSAPPPLYGAFFPSGPGVERGWNVFAPCVFLWKVALGEECGFSRPLRLHNTNQPFPAATATDAESRTESRDRERGREPWGWSQSKWSRSAKSRRLQGFNYYHIRVTLKGIKSHQISCSKDI